MFRLILSVLVLCHLSGNGQDSTVVMAGYSGFSPDGKLVFASVTHHTYKNKEPAGRKTNLLIYTGSKLSQNIDAHAGEIQAVAFRPKTTQLLTCSIDGTSKLWDYTTGKLVRQFDVGPNNGIDYGTFNMNGDLLATSSYGTVRIWDVATGKLKYSLHHDRWFVKFFDFSDDGKYIETYPSFAVQRISEQVGLPFYARSMIWELSTGRMLKFRRVDYTDTVAGPHPYRARGIDSVELKGKELWEAAKAQSITYCNCDNVKLTETGDGLVLWDAKTFEQKSGYRYRTDSAESRIGLSCNYLLTELGVYTIPGFKRVASGVPAFVSLGSMPEVGYESMNVKLSPEGKQAIFYFTYDREIRVIELPDGKELFRIPVQ